MGLSMSLQVKEASTISRILYSKDKSGKSSLLLYTIHVVQVEAIVRFVEAVKFTAVLM